MLEALKEESIVNKVGGRFKLSTLIQKRLVQLNAGSRPLVDQSTQDKMAIVLQEIVQDNWRRASLPHPTLAPASRAGRTASPTTQSALGEQLVSHQDTDRPLPLLPCVDIGQPRRRVRRCLQRWRNLAFRPARPTRARDYLEIRRLLPAHQWSILMRSTPTDGCVTEALATSNHPIKNTGRVEKALQPAVLSGRDP